MQTITVAPPFICYERHPVEDMGQFDTDCACSSSFLQTRVDRLQRPVAYDKRLFRVEAAQYAIDSDYSVLFPVNMTSQTAVVNRTSEQVWRAFDHPMSLRELAAHRWPGLSTETLVDAARTLCNLGFLSDGHICGAPVTDQDMLTAWLHVTNACNLRCTYCYVSKTDEAMDEVTGLAAIDAIVRSATQNGFKAIKLKYAGGEATLNFRLIQLLHSYAQDQTAAHGLALREVVLSNGVGVSNAMLDFLHNAGMRLMISLDGLDVEHDAQRVFRNGRGSARLVSRGIDRAFAHGVYPHLSITVTKHNADGLAATVAFALERELLFNLNFYREHDYSASHEEMAAEDARLIAGVRAAFQVIEQQLPRQSLIAALVDRSSFASPHDRPCGAGHNYLVVDHHGRIARCQMEIERSVTDVMAHDPLEVIRLQPAGFQNVSVNDKEGCRDCQWRYWCAGGCPLLTYRVTGRSDVKSPYCNVYQALFPELLRLEGLRLLKWAQRPQ